MSKDNSNKNSSRREIIKTGLKGVAIAITAGSVAKALASGKSQSESDSKGKKYVMVIDLQSCTGCGACDIACKIENNVPQGIYWHNHINKTEGKFPNVKYIHYPTLCNHCEDAPCVKSCPTRAMHKKGNNITMHDADVCIGCKTCAQACPYNAISYNDKKPHQRYRDKSELIKNCTTSGVEVTKKVGGNIIPYYNKARSKTLPGIRPKGIVEKCTFCDHRVANGDLPYCAMSCPAKAIIFGDLNDSQSEVSQLIRMNITTRLKEEMGTNPSVYYINDYNPTTRAASDKTRGKV